MILFRNVGSVLRTFDKAANDLERMMDRDVKRDERLSAYKDRVASKAKAKIDKAIAKELRKKAKANDRKAMLKAELTRASNAIEKLNEIAGY